MATIADVAKHAGVSCMTVSRVINNKGYISEETRLIVQKAIAELDYHPNLVARSLASGFSNTIGLLCTNIKNPIYARYIDGLCQDIRNSSRDFILYMADDSSSIFTGISTLASKQVDGLIVLPVEVSDITSSEEEYSRMLAQIYERIRVIGKPAVFIGPYRNSGFSCVYEDYESGAEMATEYLLSLGHSEIGFISGNGVGGYPWEDRKNGYLRTMENHRLPVRGEWMLEVTSNLTGASVELERLLFALPALPTAFYCASDILAVAVIHVLTKHGIRVPEDISVLGHDDGPYARSCYPAISTIAISPRDTAAEAARILLGSINGAGTPPETRPMAPKLRTRESTAARADA